MTWNNAFPVADGHADTLAVLNGQKRSFWRISERGHLDLPRLIEAGMDLQVLAVCSEERKDPGKWAEALIREFIGQLPENADHALLLASRKDWAEWRKTGKIGLVLALEGLEPLGSDPEALDRFYRLGVRMATLTWNHTNDFAGGAKEDGGLTKVGREVLRRMEGLGMALDLSHLNPESFWDVVGERPNCPVLASHSNAGALHPHLRNLDDDQIKAISKLNGTVGVALHPPFLAEDGAGIEDLVRHIRHILALGGAGCPALGCDFDGIPQPVRGVRDVRDLPRVFEELRIAFPEGEWRGVIGANLCRVLERTGA